MVFRVCLWFKICSLAVLAFRIWAFSRVSDGVGLRRFQGFKVLLGLGLLGVGFRI